MKLKKKLGVALATLVFCLLFYIFILWWVRIPVSPEFYLGTPEQQEHCKNERFHQGFKNQVSIRKGWAAVPLGSSCTAMIQKHFLDIHKPDSTLRKPLDTSLASVNCSSKALNKEGQVACELEWVTLVNRCSENLNQLAMTLQHSNIKLSILGLRTPWLGFGRRIRMIRDYLKSLPRNKIVIVADGDDSGVLPTCSASQMVDAFLKHQTPILFTGERVCCSQGYSEKDYPPKPPGTSYLWLNAGGYMGYVGDIIDVIDKVYEYECMNDQSGFTQVFVSKWGVSETNGSRKFGLPSELDSNATPFIKLDYYNSIFQILYPTDESDFDFSLYKTQGTIRNTETNGTPCIYHQNGWKGHPGIMWPKIVERLQLVKELKSWNLGPVSDRLFEY